MRWIFGHELIYKCMEESAGGRGLFKSQKLIAWICKSLLLAYTMHWWKLQSVWNIIFQSDFYYRVRLGCMVWPILMLLMVGC